MATKIKIKTGGPGDGTYIKPTTSLDTTADVRDLLTFIAGKGANMADPDVKASFARLAALKGLPTAQKLYTQLSLHGQRPEVATMTPQQRIQSFYDIGSSDPEAGQIIQQAKAFGQGPISGYYNSSLLGNQQLQGLKLPTKQETPATSAVKVKIQKAMK